MPPTLGRQAPKSGILKAGFAADVIALAGDPLKDIQILANPRNITHVWKAGQLVKGSAD